MPIYAFKCSECGHELERMQGVSDALPRKCPECGKLKLQKQVTAAQLHSRYSPLAPRHMRGQKRR